MKPKSVVVFVTDQSDCLRLIRHGNAIAARSHISLQVISIQPTCQLTPFATQQLQTLYNCTKKLGGEMTILFNKDTVLTAAVAAKQLNAVHIVSGTPGTAFIDRVRLLIPELPWTVVSTDEHTVTYPPMPAVKAAVS